MSAAAPIEFDTCVSAPVVWSIENSVVVVPVANRYLPEGSTTIFVACGELNGDPAIGVAAPVLESNLYAEIDGAGPPLYPPELLTYRNRSCGSVIARNGEFPAGTLACTCEIVPSPLIRKISRLDNS